MKKKFLLFIIILTLAVSCGKKADPEFNESKNKYESLLTEKDINDLNTIKNIELEDENQHLTELKASLKKFEKFSPKSIALHFTHSL